MPFPSVRRRSLSPWKHAVSKRVRHREVSSDDPKLHLHPPQWHFKELVFSNRGEWLSQCGHTSSPPLACMHVWSRWAIGFLPRMREQIWHLLKSREQWLTLLYMHLFCKYESSCTLTCQSESWRLLNSSPKALDCGLLAFNLSPPMSSEWVTEWFIEWLSESKTLPWMLEPASLGEGGYVDRVLKEGYVYVFLVNAYWQCCYLPPSLHNSPCLNSCPQRYFFLQTDSVLNLVP